MANVPVQFSLSFQDYQGVRGSEVFNADLVDTTTLAALATQLSTLATTVDAVTGAAIIGVRATLLPALPGGLKAAVAGADLEKTLLINFGNAANRNKSGQDIPGVNPAVLTGGKIDLTQAAVAALITLIEGNYTNAALQALTAVRDAAITFRKRKRELDRVSTVA